MPLPAAVPVLVHVAQQLAGATLGRALDQLGIFRPCEPELL
jgi:hypothetical protein